MSRRRRIGAASGTCDGLSRARQESDDRSLSYNGGLHCENCGRLRSDDFLQRVEPRQDVDAIDEDALARA